MDSIVDVVKRRLREAGPASWEAIADAAGVSKALPRKIVYGERANPRVLTIQPLVEYFAAIDAAAAATNQGEAS